MGEGRPEELRDTDSDWVRQFMQGLPDGPVPFHYPAPPYVEDLLRTDAAVADKAHA
jgi:phospholipid/cholesterol/gamma-HCH transport system ATP-binding protein